MYNLLGQKVVTLVDEDFQAGMHSITWLPLDLANGVYFLRVQSGNCKVSKKMVYTGGRKERE